MALNKWCVDLKEEEIGAIYEEEEEEEEELF